MFFILQNSNIKLIELVCCIKSAIKGGMESN